MRKNYGYNTAEGLVGRLCHEQYSLRVFFHTRQGSRMVHVHEPREQQTHGVARRQFGVKQKNWENVVWDVIRPRHD